MKCDNERLSGGIEQVELKEWWARQDLNRVNCFAEFRIFALTFTIQRFMHNHQVSPYERERTFMQALCQQMSAVYEVSCRF